MREERGRLYVEIAGGLPAGEMGFVRGTRVYCIPSTLSTMMIIASRRPSIAPTRNSQRWDVSFLGPWAAATSSPVSWQSLFVATTHSRQERRELLKFR